MTSRKVVMLDRDGTLNSRIRGGYLLKSEDIQRATDLDSLGILEELGFCLSVVTNQACVSKKLIDIATVKSLTREILYPATEISDSQLFICIHQDFEDCLCRKPKPKLLHDCLAHNKASIGSAFFIGDSLTDKDAAQEAGVSFIGVCWDGECLGPSCSHTLSGAVSHIVAMQRMEEEQ